MASGQVIAKHAFDKLAASISRDDKIVFRETTVAELWMVVRDIEKQQRARRDVRFMSRIEAFIHTVDSYSGIINILCQGYPPMSFVWGPVKLILNLARNFTKILDIILQALNDIAENLPRIDRLKATFPDDGNLNRVVAWIYSDILEFHGRAYKMFRRRAWHYYFAFDWGLFSKRFNSVLLNLSKHCELLDKEAASAHFAEMRDFRDKRQREDERYEKQRRAQIMQDVVTYLSESEDAQEEYLHRISDKRLPMTCNWLLDDDQVKSWLDDSTGCGILWMTGIPGAGKSFLTSLLIEHLWVRGGLTCVYYFCGQNEASEPQCRKILRTMTMQLIQQNLDVALIVHETLVQNPANKSTAALKKMLLDILPQVDPVHFLVDGLDELDHDIQRELLKTFTDIVKKTNGKSRLFISSRDEPQIKSLLPKSQMKLEGKTTESLRRYIAKRVGDLKEHHPEMEPTTVEKIESRLHEHAKGMFLWVRLVIAMLREKGSIGEIEASIEDLPDGLDKAYGRILGRFKFLHSNLRKRVFKILSWLCAARRPVSVYEVIDGIALDFDQRELCSKWKIQNFYHHMVDLCAPLIEVAPNQTLQIVHFSAKEHLLDSRSGPFIQEGFAHFDISKSCIINLTSAVDFVPGLTTYSEKDLERRVAEGRYGLNDFAREHWADHFLHCMADQNMSSDDKTLLFDEIKKLCRLSKRAHITKIIPETVLQSPHVLVGFQKLGTNSEVQCFVASCLCIHSKIDEIQTAIDSQQAQEESLLLSDDTFMTLAKIRLRNVTEKILALKSEELPEHIDSKDHEAFLQRYKFCCRHIGCSHEFRSNDERTDHESGHIVSLPCPHCDFSLRGFSSRKTLERHIQTYHLDPETFEIPSSIRSMSDFSGGLSLSKRRISGSAHWSERGRKAMQKGLQQILRQVNSVISGMQIESRKEEQTDSFYSSRLEILKRNVDQDHYQTLGDFKKDVRRSLVVVHSSEMLLSEATIDAACRYGLKSASTEFPAFSNPETALQVGIDQLKAGNDDKQPDSILRGSPTNEELDEGIIIQRSTIYWSQVDKRHVLDLLRQLGKDFSKIAGILCTKTAHDVESYFSSMVEKGEPEFALIAESTDSFVKESLITPDVLGQSEPAGGSLPVTIPFNANLDIVAQTNIPLLQLSTSSFSGVTPAQAPAPLRTDHARGALEEAPMNPDLPPRKKRRPPPRAFCQYCKRITNGFHDEYALNKHLNRYHSRMRKVWVCKDVSFEKKFLRGCRTCSTKKQYKAKYDACKHLRSAHFNRKTPAETLARWMRQIEAFNPNYREPAKSARPSYETKSRRLPPINRKLNSLPQPFKSPFYSNSGGQNQYCDTGHTTSDLNCVENADCNHGDLEDNDQSTDSDHGSTASDSGDEFKDDAVFRDVSFDTLLGIQSLYASGDPGSEKHPHRSNKAVIQPHQISSLPKLDPDQRNILSDQVEALHNTLDCEKENSIVYQAQLRKLRNISKKLAKDLLSVDFTIGPLEFPESPVVIA